MRVIAGTARSLKLKTPEGLDTRPTTDRIKETLFNMIQFSLPSSVFVDLYSGSGAIGIEALSRGAQKCYFVENNTAAVNCIKENINFTKFENQTVVLKKDVLSSLRELNDDVIDFVFMDPPYHLMEESSVLRALSKMKNITEQTVVICEASIEREVNSFEECGFKIIKIKNYKTNKHIFMQREKDES
ncbi:MAG: 16S rRNA (guanine(966)-N(2))-methyltransferase RsmD [Lachnospiraceae bacterium]|nr:16S rRNA (guanine(966)-N(2))-methyltransferase RsmD [Lachnospiraceae bacterium]